MLLASYGECMIACLQGELFFKSSEKLIVMVGGVGYEVSATASCLGGLPEIGHQILIHVHTHVREDALLLYGFVDDEEKKTYLQLVSVSGVGPKLGLSILSGISPAELASAISGDDLARLTKLSGVGKKTAERLCLELKDKLSWIPAYEKDQAGHQSSVQDEITTDGVSALVNLGYSLPIAEDVVQKIVAENSDPKTITLEYLIKEALRRLA